MKILIACEFSGTVRDAFTALGHDATSCDLLPTERPGKHYQGDVLDIINEGWDMMIAHPPCTYLCRSGLHWNKRMPGRQQKTEEALEFVAALLNAPIPKIAIENPVGCISTRIFKHINGKYCVFPTKTRGGLEPSQIIQPYQFGEDASKKTCLWLLGLPLLKPTGYFPPRITEGGKKRWGNQTDSGQNNLWLDEDRWMKRSRTYQGIANAMADKWSKAETQIIQLRLVS